MQKICNNCGTESENAIMPYAVHETAMAQNERHTKSLVRVIVLLIVLLVGSNAGWLIYNSQFDDAEETTTTITQDNTDGYNNYIGNDGDIINGKTDDNN